MVFENVRDAILTTGPVEVGELERAQRPVHEKVVGLNVAVDEAMAVHVAKSLHRLQEQAK